MIFFREMCDGCRFIGLLSGLASRFSRAILFLLAFLSERLGIRAIRGILYNFCI